MRNFVLLLITLFAIACTKTEDAKPKGEETAKTPAPPESKPAPAPRHPWIDEAGRGGAKCEFEKFDGTGKDRVGVFKVTMPPGHEKGADFMQTWIFYYDKAGAQISRYPHATGYDGSGQKALGSKGDDIKKETDSVECEITAIRYADKTGWINENLVPCCSDRPKGGFSDAELKANSGEKVLVEVVDAKLGKVKLKNASDKEIKRLKVTLVYRKADGTYGYVDKRVDISIKPGESLEKTVEFSNNPITDSKGVEGWAPEVTFADNKEWKNTNLGSTQLLQ